tara:strand:- start:718 stop:942 length:225 start_codon:yes stop_codon:yes gene_type:complete
MRDFINGRGKWVSDTSAHTGNWNYIKAITDIVINEYTGALEGFVSGVTVQAMDLIRIDATSVTLSSGTAILYHE